MKSFLALACLALVLVPAPVNAQSGLTMSIAGYPSTAHAGDDIGVYALVINSTSGKMRATVTFTSLSPCGKQTTLGYNRLSLYPNQGIQLSVQYALPADACPGTYAVTISSGGGKNSVGSSATTYITVQ
jgi:hypothetical protein